MHLTPRNGDMPRKCETGAGQGRVDVVEVGIFHDLFEFKKGLCDLGRILGRELGEIQAIRVGHEKLLARQSLN